MTASRSPSTAGCTASTSTALTGGKHVTIYGQTEVTRDLMDQRDAAGLTSVFEAANVLPQDFDGDGAVRHLRQGWGDAPRIDCDFIAGCDGYHGVSRRSAPQAAIRTFERQYPFGWLGVLAEVPPADHELVYANHASGFALCSMRSPHRSRYYVQCPLDDQRRGLERRALLGRTAAPAAGSGRRGRHHRPVVREIDRAAALLRRRADAVRATVPGRRRRPHRAADRRQGPQPRGERRRYLFSGLREFYREKSQAGIDAYSARALARVWKAVRFSWWMTTVLHRFPDTGAFGQRIQEAELDYLVHSQAASTALAENYVGLPY